MPYRHAHWFVLALFPLAAMAFWTSYVSKLSSSPLQFHAHGITATLWLALLAAQSWTMRLGRRRLHATLGLSSLALFPLFLAGGAGIFFGMAQRYAAAATPFHVMYAPRLAWLDVVAAAGFAAFYSLALRHRRNVHLHAGYLLATAIFLLPPILGRLSQALPPLAIAGPDDFWKAGVGFQLANAVTAAIAFAVAAARGRRNGPPFLAAGGLTVASAILYEVPGGLPAWRAVYGQAATLPILPFAFAAAVVGIVIAYAGWTAGRRPASPPREAPAAA